MTMPMKEQKKYIDIIAQIAQYYAQMKRLRPLPQAGIRRFVEEFSINTSHNSTAIEGNTFTYDETRMLIKEGVMSSARSFAEHEEIVGYKKAFDSLYVAVKNKELVDKAFILRLHENVLFSQDGAGSFRDGQVFVGNLFSPTYVPPDGKLVDEKMQTYISSLRIDMEKNLLMKEHDSINCFALFHNLAKHHIEFEKIHPFYDGNGRTGRLLMIYELISLGLLPIDIRYEQRTHYYAALKAYDNRSKYSDRLDSNTEPMAKLLAEAELASMRVWHEMFD